MKNKGILISLAVVLVIGMLITKMTHYWIESGSPAGDMTAVPAAEGILSGPAEETVDVGAGNEAGKDDMAAGEDMGAAKAQPMSSYRKRLQDLDSQMEKNRELQSASNRNSSAKSAASGELKLWDSELNSIYGAMMELLDEEASARLVQEQRAWLKERDSVAMEAVKNSPGGSSESVEYTMSLIESTRERAYVLVEMYEQVYAE